MKAFAKNNQNTASNTFQSNGSNTYFGVQAKLSIGKPNDTYEKEADATADKIVTKSEPSFFKGESFFPARANPSTQKKSDEEIQQKETTEEIQEKPLASGLTPTLQLEPQEEVQQQKTPTIQKLPFEDIQKKEEEALQEKEDDDLKGVQNKTIGEGDEGNNAAVENTLKETRGKGVPLNSVTKNEMESGFGADFSGVRIHNDSKAAEMSQQLGAQAFTSGNDIYFNTGKYNPESAAGKHLLAHELTHTVQQGASAIQPQLIQKKEEAQPPTTEIGVPTKVVDISNGLNLTNDWLSYIEKNSKVKEFNVSVKIGMLYTGVITLKKLRKIKEGESQKFELASTKKGRHLDVNGMQFLNPLKQSEIYPILVLHNFGEEQKTGGFLSIRRKETAITKNAVGIIDGINENLTAMNFLGLGAIKSTKGLENKFENGVLNFKANDLSVAVDGYIEATGSIGITNSAFTFELNSMVDVAGLASGTFTISKGEDGTLSGKGAIAADIANVSANLVVTYDKGAVSIQGTGKMNSEKFSGEITLLVTDVVKSKQMMHAALGTEVLDKEKETSAKPVEAITKQKGNQVLAGWGEVQATITPWLEGTAKIGIDSKGQVTIVGEVVVPNEVELMEQRGKKVDLFKVEIRAGYGIPLVGQVFLFASIGMFMNSGFGPLVLKNVGFTGTYSTDPDVLQNFSITGTLGINAFAIIGLEAEAGVGVTLIGHDLKAGVNVTAAAGLRAYAEATPIFKYEEAQNPAGGKVGESRLKGHFEAEAQLFLQLSGALFYELDSPWWSPAPDGREEFPLGDVQYPIGDSLGIGADMDWLVGSGEAPELAFTPVEFDPDKFTADIMADPPPKKRGKADAAAAGEWKGEPGGEQQKIAKVTGDGKGLPENTKKKEDLKKLPDEQKYMRALDEMAKLESVKPKPTYAVVHAKANKIRSKYGLDKIALIDKKDDSVSVFVKHAKEDNGKHVLKIPLMSEAERLILLNNAMTDLRIREKKAIGELGKIDESGAQKMLVDWLKAHPVIENAKVVDGKETWDYFIDIGNKSETEKGKPKMAAPKVGAADTIKEKNKEVKEVQITSEDKKNHVEIANTIEKELNKSTSEENFEVFYKNKQQQIKKLEDVHQPQLKKGINLDIHLQPLNKSKNEVIVSIKIRPNNLDRDVNITQEPIEVPVDNSLFYTKWEGKVVYISSGKRLNKNFEKDADKAGYEFFNPNHPDLPQQIKRKGGFAEKIKKLSINSSDKLLEEGEGKQNKPTHNNFNPKEITITQKGGNYVATYETRNADDTKTAEFTIEISFDQIVDNLPDVTQVRKVTGKNLSNKPTGIGRGNWDSASNGFDNAHIIGDQFGGAGKNGALNIYPSSDNYNRKKMAEIENTIAAYFKLNRQSYDLSATAYLTDDSESPQNLKKYLGETFDKENSNVAAPKEVVATAENKLIKELQSEITKDVKDLPAQFSSVEYESESIAEGFKLDDIAATEHDKFSRTTEDKEAKGKKTKKITIGEDTGYDALKKAFKKTNVNSGTTTKKAK